MWYDQLIIEVLEFVNDKDESPFANWFNALNAQAAAKVSTALIRMEHENLSNTKSVHGGVFEYRIDFGPGYRVYFGKDGENLIILLGGGTKNRQDNDIKKAKALWQLYKKLKKGK